MFEKLRTTPILIILGVAFLIVLFASFYNLLFDSAGGNGLEGFIGLIFSAFLFLMLLIEQAIVKRLKIRDMQLAMIELILLPILATFFYFVFVSLAG